MSPATSGIRRGQGGRSVALRNLLPTVGRAQRCFTAFLVLIGTLLFVTLDGLADDVPSAAAANAATDPGAAEEAEGGSASHASTTLEAAGYLVRRWGIVDGLPGDQVNAVIQTSDGYIWSSFLTGLARFDGHQFTVFRSGTDGVPPGIVQRLHEDSRGRLLCIREGNRPPIVHDGVRFSTLGDAASVHHNLELTTVSDAGDLWKLNTNHGTVWRLQQDEFVMEMQADLQGVGQIRDFAVEDGIPWIIGGPRLFRLTTEGAIPYQGLGRDSNDGSVQSGFFRNHDGALMILADRAIHRIEGTNCHREIEFPNTADVFTTRVCLDRFGTLWTGRLRPRPELIAHFPNGGVARSPAGRSGLITRIMADSEGNVWVASRDGLFQSVPVPFQTPREVEFLPSRQLVALTSHPDGHLWMVGDFAISRYSRSRGTMATFTNLFMRENETMVHAAISRDGTVWVAAWGSHIARVSPDGKQVLERLSIPETARVPIYHLFEASDGTLWVVTPRGLWRKHDGALSQHDIPPPFRNRAVFNCAEDPEGRIHFAAHGIIFHLEGHEWREEHLPDPMNQLNPMALTFGPDGTGWWLGLTSPLTGEEAGLAIRTGDQWIFLDSDATGLDCRAFGLALGKDDALWISSPERGLFRFSQKNLRAYAAGEADHIGWERFTEFDGMPSACCIEYVSRGLHITPDGRVWVPTTAGPTSLDPARLKLIQSARMPPRTRIERILVDDQPPKPLPAKGADSPHLTLPPDAHRLEIHYTSIHLTSPAKVRFRYRLVGYDNDWVEAGNRRTAYYQNLPPGNYRFEVMSALAREPWGAATASMDIRALPLWWQTFWFRAALAILAMAILWFTRLAKLRQLKRERVRREEFARRLIESQEAERKRIAGELHDSMGQNLLIAKNQLYLLQMSADSETQEKIRQVADNVGAALEEARSISHQLRPFQLERLGLTRAINSMLKQASNSTGIPVHSSIVSVDGLLPPESEVMVYRILQEAMSNIVKHADASEVHVTIEPSRRHVRMVVRDDGRGFDPAKLLNPENAPSGLGLTSFQERTNLLRGHFNCQSAPGNGTTLTFEIPIPESSTNEAEGTHRSRG